MKRIVILVKTVYSWITAQQSSGDNFIPGIKPSSILASFFMDKKPVRIISKILAKGHIWFCLKMSAFVTFKAKMHFLEKMSALVKNI